MGLAIFSMILFTSAAVLLIEWNSVEVTVPGVGKVRGRQFFVERRRMYSFFGLHFALSTAGKRRFMRPAAVATEKQVIDATARKPGCIQKLQSVSGRFAINRSATTEDCLHLNIWTPCTAATEPGCGKTVIVFFFATGFQNGGNNLYDASYLSALGDVVVVAPNFRLGLFGFLGVSGPDVPANVALYDQQLAMEWVLSHIQYFGGNHSNVVPMGGSSGSWSVGAQLLSTNPFWRNNFHRFIFQSESPFRRFFPARLKDIAPLVGCANESGEDLVRCLRSVPTATIIDVTRNPIHFLGPTFTDDLLPEPPWKAAVGVDIRGKDVLLGVVSDEGCYLASRLKTIANKTSRSLTNIVLSVYHIEHMYKFVETYASWHDRGTWASSLIGDILFVCPMLSFASDLAFKGNRVRAFIFAHRPSYTIQPLCMGAGTYDLLDFVFGKPLQDARVGTFEEAALSRRVIDMWTGFAKTGELPNVRGRAWPNFTANARYQVRIEATEMHLVADFNDSNCVAAAEYLPELSSLRRKEMTLQLLFNDKFSDSNDRP